MKKKYFLHLLQVFILLSPLPFGCVGPVFSPLFYMILLALGFYGLGVSNEGSKQGEGVRRIVENKWIKFSFFGYMAFVLLQIVPLPFFLVRLLSPNGAGTLISLKDSTPAFATLSLVPWETVLYGLKFLSVSLFFWVILRISLEKKEIIALFNTMILCASLQGVFGLLKFLTGNKYFFLFFHPLENGEQVSRLTGTLGNENHFAFFLEMVFPLVLALFLLKIRYFGSGQGLKYWVVAVFNADKKTLGYALVTLILGISILLTGSRAGVITLGLSFLIFAQMSFYLKQPGSLKKKLWVIFMSITILSVMGGFQHTMNRFARTKFEDNSRFLRWSGTLDMAADYPILGTGLGTYRYAYYLYDSTKSTQWSTHAHNEYLELLSEGGILGFFLFLFFLGAVSVSVVRLWMEREHPVVKMVGIGVFTSLFVAIFHSIFDFSLRIPSNLLYLVLILSLGIRMITYKKADQRPS